MSWSGRITHQKNWVEPIIHKNLNLTECIQEERLLSHQHTHTHTKCGKQEVLLIWIV
jgi:hypothetical protein